VVRVSAPTPAGSIYVQVITAAGGTCECAGVCGRDHRSGGGRCARGHAAAGVLGESVDLMTRLYAAPADPSVPAHQAYRVPIEDLTAWCGPCLDGAQRLAKAAATTDPASVPSLFDLDSPGGS
jgi:hypothetical protein